MSQIFTLVSTEPESMIFILLLRSTVIAETLVRWPVSLPATKETNKIKVILLSTLLYLPLFSARSQLMIVPP